MNLGLGFLLGFWVSSASAQTIADDCDNTKSWVDYSAKGFKNETEMYADCVAQGHPIIGGMHDSVLNGARLAEPHPVTLQPEIGGAMLQLGRMSSSCMSRVYFDAVCSRHSDLFASPYPRVDGCPLPGVFEPSQEDLTRLGVGMFIGLRWDLCTSFSTAVIPSPLKVGPGHAWMISTGGANSTTPLVSNKIEFSELSTTTIALENLVVAGDLNIHHIVSDSLQLSRMVVLGNVTITESDLQSFTLESVWIDGDLVVRDSTFEFVRLRSSKVANVLHWNGNDARLGKINSYYTEDLDLPNAPVVQGNTWEVDSSSDSDSYAKFLNGLGTAHEWSIKLRSGSN